MKAPAFWWQPNGGAAAAALAPVAAIWGAVAARRMARPPAYRAPVPVVCIGNFVVGGAGKTPTALAVARLAADAGLAPAFLTRGYGGTERGPHRVDLAADAAERVGDEALLLAAEAPTMVSADRAAGARRLAAAGAGLIVMDDGFQNPGLAKDVSLVVVDGATGIGNGRVLPAGPLRAPLGPQLARASALVVVGAGMAARPLIALAAERGLPVIEAALRPVAPQAWAGVQVVAFAGIGRPQKFFASLAETGAVVEAAEAFADHHRFTEADAARLLDLAGSTGLRLVTTAKDHARLAGATGRLATLRQVAVPFSVVLQFARPDTVAVLIRAAARQAQR